MLKRTEIESKSQIRAAAYRLMWSLGYEEASYTAIADACGLGRPLVQKHFPKKEQILCGLIEDAINACIFILGDRGLLTREVASDLVRAAQLFYSVLLQDEQTKRLAKYALRQESISAAAATIHARYAYMLGLGSDLAELRDSIVWAMGGLGQLIVEKMNNGEELDANAFAVQSITALLVINDDVRFSETQASLQKELLDHRTIETLSFDVMEQVLGTRDPMGEKEDSTERTEGR